VSETFQLYLVVSNPVAGFAACAEAAVAAGLPYVQLRLKNVPYGALLRVGREMRAVTRGTPTKFIVNDDVIAARDIDADGVHLGQSDMKLREARLLWPDSNSKVFGLSTHDEAQAAAAASDSPDYIGVGPVYATPTKDVPDPVLGVARAAVTIKTSSITAFAIGGIDRNRITELAGAGIRRAAVVRYVCERSRPLDAIRELQDAGNNAIANLTPAMR
jgi:thiamine-phosphate pyrophosphorylase